MTINVTELKKSLGKYLTHSQTEDVLITSKGKVISVLTSPFANHDKSTKRQPKLITLDMMSKKEFDAMMEDSYNQAMNGEGIELDVVYKKLLKNTTHKK